MSQSEDALVLSDQLCFALYAASRAMTARYRPRLDELGLTYPQYLVLVALWDDDESSVSALGQQLRLDSGTLSPLLSRLERNGLIRRDRDPADARSVLVSATEAGRRLRDEAVCIPDAIRESLSGVDEANLVNALHDLETCLRDTE